MRSSATVSIVSLIRHSSAENGISSISLSEGYYAFLRESPEEKLLVVYNNSGASRDLKILLADTPLQGAQHLQLLFGSAAAGLAGDEVQLTLAPHTIAVFTLR